MMLRILVFILACYAVIAQAIAPMQIKVEITGISDALEEQVRQELSLFYLRGDPVISPSLMDVYLDRAEEEIAFALEPHGYYNPTIRSQKVFKDNHWYVTFRVEQGKPVVIRSLNIDIIGGGKHFSLLNEKKRTFQVQVGDILTHESYESAKKELLNTAVLSGFLSAEFTTHIVEVDADQNTAEISLVLDTAAMYYFGPTQFSNSALQPDFLQRYLHYKPGDSFSADNLVILEERLRKSDYFSQVNIHSQPDHDNFNVPISVELEDNKPNHYLLGIGYGTDTGARGKVGYLRRRVNSSGHKFQTEIQLSEIFQKIEATYTIPGKRPYSDSIILRTEYIEDEYSEKPVDSFELGLSEKRDIYGWERTLSLVYLKEESVSFITNAKRKDTLLMPMLELKKSIRDNPNNPRNGTTRIFRIKGSLENVGSDISFAQIYYQQRWLHTFENDLKSLLRLELGATAPQTEDKVPLSQRFFAGGDTSIRGFGFRSLPAEIDIDDVTQPVGGSYLLISSLELSRPIRAPLSGHIFVDAGNAFRTSRDNIQVGVGAGFSYDTRFGPIKLSVAKPLTNAASSWRIHASFGPEV